jgi:hypothetical protein
MTKATCGPPRGDPGDSTAPISIAAAALAAAQRRRWRLAVYEKIVIFEAAKITEATS